jgi:hypothetical protein
LPEGEGEKAEITGIIPVVAVSDRRPVVDRRSTLQDVAPAGGNGRKWFRPSF